MRGKKLKDIKDLPDGHYNAEMHSIRLIKKDGKVRYEMSFKVDGRCGSYTFWSLPFPESSGKKTVSTRKAHRRHRIIKVRLTKTALYLITKSGALRLSMKNFRSLGRLVRLHLPHYAETLLDQGTWETKDLRRLLTGKYLYGRSTEVKYQGAIFNIIE